MAATFSNCGLAVEDKLDAIRHLDPTGIWQSLDDLRYCGVCKKLLSGRQIEVVEGARGLGPLRLHCPTPGCDSSPADWKSSAAFRGRMVWRVLAVNENGSVRR